jgi:cell division protein FtsW (lipid II flippase)
LALLSWAQWMPPLLIRARHALNGQASLALTIRAPQHAVSPRQNLSLVLIATGIASLAYASPAAVVKGLITGALVLLAWVTVAWITAFASPVFETFERGAWSVVEQLAPQRGMRHWWDAIPESWLIVACLCAELALRWPRSLAVLSALIIIVAAIPRRARRTPDPIAAAAGAALFTLCISSSAAVSENGSMAAFVLVVFVALASVRIGRAVQGRLADAQPRARSRFLPLVLIAPLLLLAQLALIDMGLFLVVVLPIGFATLLAVDSRVARRAMLVPAAAFALLAALLIGKVLFPPVDEIRRADSHLAKAEAFGHMSQLFHVSLPGSFGQSMNRVAARALATRDPGLAEEMLVSAQPGPARDLLIPSIEQIWGAKAYSQGGLTGLGLGRAVIGGRGVAEPVSYAENAFSVFILAEHGALGGVTILALYILLAGAALFASLSNGGTPASHRASRALFIVATLLLVIPAVYVALSNLGYVPITGQNMPFLGLNSWSDVALCSGAVGILITGLVRRAEGEA